MVIFGSPRRLIALLVLDTMPGVYVRFCVSSASPRWGSSSALFLLSSATAATSTHLTALLQKNPGGVAECQGEFSSKKTNAQPLDNANPPLCWIVHVRTFGFAFQGDKKTKQRGSLSLHLLSIFHLCHLPSLWVFTPSFRYLPALTGTIAAGNKLLLIYAVLKATHSPAHRAPEKAPQRPH